jgi:hypothetical protein
MNAAIGGVIGALTPEPTPPPAPAEPVKMATVEVKHDCRMMPTLQIQLACEVEDGLGEEGKRVLERSAVACVLGGSVTSSMSVAERLVTKAKSGRITLPALAVGCLGNVLKENKMKIVGVNDDDVPGG